GLIESRSSAACFTEASAASTRLASSASVAGVVFVSAVTDFCTAFPSVWSFCSYAVLERLLLPPQPARTTPATARRASRFIECVAYPPMLDTTPSWGVDPVPERLRVLSGLDSTLLWGNLSVSLLVIVIGALLVPALSLRDALLAILVGAVVGNVLLGVAALIGADARVPGMVLLRAPLGRRGSYAPTLLNVAQNVGWSTFELIIIATAAAALSRHLFGFSGR